MIFNGYYIERVNSNNLKDLAYLFKNVQGKDVSINYLLEKFETKWTGVQYLGYIAYSLDGEPSAFYGTFPCFLTNGIHTILSSQTGDVITGLKHQKKGLFLELAKLTHELAKNEGIKVVFGFPNENSSYGFFNKLGWTNIGKLNSYKVNFSVLKLYNYFHYFNATQFLYFLYFNLIYFFIKESETIENSNIDSCSYGILRDKKFYKYKTYGKNYRIKWFGYKLWIKFDDGICVGDIEKFNINEQQNQFWSKLNLLCLLMGISKVWVHCSPGSFLETLFSHKYVSTACTNIGYLTLDEECKLEKLMFSTGDIDDF